MPAKTDYHDRIALITGASRGIGRSVAKGFAAHGAHVVALARPKSVSALEALDDEVKAAGQPGITIVPLDLTDGKGVDNLGAALFERFGRLDILIANAGILGPLSPIGHIAPKDFEKVMAVNVTAQYRLIRSMDPLLRQSPAGRAIFLTSGATQKNRPYWGAYAASKAAVEMMVKTYAEEVKDTQVRVTLIDPGATATDMRATAFPGEDPDTLPSPEDLVPLFLEIAHANYGGHGQRVAFREWRAT